MKMFAARTPVAVVDPFTLSEVKAHLRVDHGDDDEAIDRMARAAAAELEQVAQIALLTQTIRVTIFDPDPDQYLILPIGPMLDGETPVVVVDGVSFTDFEIEPGNRPAIRWGDETWSELVDSIRVKITYSAGFGSTAADIPGDLAQALMDQTALHYDARGTIDRRDHITSPHMARIAARYRGVQA